MSAEENSSSENEAGFAFLSDQPLRTDEELADPKFGHEDIAKTLARVVATCPSPFTIGLFGRWGSGKSTVANLLRRELQAQNIPVVIFDVWKHQDDALRRTFLRESLLQLKAQGFDAIDAKYELDERLDKNVQLTEGKPGLSIPWKRIGHVLLGIVAVLVLLVLLDSCVSGLHYTRQLWQGAVALGVAGGLLGAAALLVKTMKFLQDMTDFILSRFVSSKAVTYTVDKFSDPRDFEEEFGRLLLAMHPQRLVVVFDNLDRVTQERAVQVLTTIKTFLEPEDIAIKEKEAVFVIPCDVDAIRQHIAGVYKAAAGAAQSFSPDEFLRKFFNAVFWIPDFIPSELESYTKSMLGRTKVPDLSDDKVAWIITRAYRDNPRQIKQFINTLLANYLLVRERQGEGKDYPKDFLATGTSQLTKFLLLNQLFSDDMKIVHESRTANLEEAIRDPKFPRGDDSRSFREFVAATAADFPMRDVRPFFTLRRSEQGKQFPGIDDFLVSLEDQQVAKAEAYLRGLEDFDARRTSLSQVIRERLSGMTNGYSLATSIAALLSALDSNGQELAETAYVDVFQHLTNGAAGYLHVVPPAVLARQVMQPFPHYRQVMADRLVAIFLDLRNDPRQFDAGEAYLRELLGVVFEHPDWFVKHASDVQAILSERFAGPVWVLQAVNSDATAQDAFVTPSFVTNVVSSLSGEDIESGSLVEKSRGLLLLPRTDFDPASYHSVVAKLQELLVYENGHPLDDARRPVKESVLSVVEKLLSDLAPGLGADPDQDARNGLCSQLREGADGIPDWDSRAPFIPAVLSAEHLAADPELVEVRGLVSGFLQSASVDAVGSAVEKTAEPSHLVGRSGYESLFLERALQDPAFFDRFYPVISEEDQQRWLLALLARDHSRLLSALDARAYEVPGAAELCAGLLSIVEARVATGDKPILQALNRMRCGADGAQTARYSKILERDLTTSDEALQAEGLEALGEDHCLDEQAKRALTKKVLDWLRAPGLVDKYQRYAILAVLHEHELLNSEERREFVQFIFEELVRKGTDTTHIEFGFEQLSILKPAYPDRKANFDDVRARFDTEPAEDTKAALARGLGSLRPKRTNKGNKEFWEWVDGLL